MLGHVILVDVEGDGDGNPYHPSITGNYFLVCWLSRYTGGPLATNLLFFASVGAKRILCYRGFDDDYTTIKWR